MELVAGNDDTALSADAAADICAPAAGAEGRKLTPEEQMALFEQHLKENDWGHQPC